MLPFVGKPYIYSYINTCINVCTFRWPLEKVMETVTWAASGWDEQETLGPFYILLLCNHCLGLNGGGWRGVGKTQPHTCRIRGEGLVFNNNCWPFSASKIVLLSVVYETSVSRCVCVCLLVNGPELSILDNTLQNAYFYCYFPRLCCAAKTF